MDVTMPQLGETVTEGTITVVQAGRRDRSRSTSRCSRCRPTRSTPRCPRPRRGADRDPRARRRHGRGRRAARGARRRAPDGAAPPRRPRPRPSRHPRPRPHPRREPAPRRRRRPPPAPAPPRPGSGAARRRRPSGTAAPAAEPRRPAAVGPSRRRSCAADRRAGPRSRADHRHRRRRAHHRATTSSRRPRPARTPRRLRRTARAAARRPARSARAAPPRARPCARTGRGARVPAVRARRRGRPVRQHPAPHRRAHGAVEGDERARLHVGARSTSSASSASGARTRRAWKPEEGFSLTYLPFIVRAFCDVVHDYPNVNASVDGDSLVVHHDVHLGIAVDLEFKGLIAPVIRNADGKRLRLIAREIRDLATRAKSKQLGPDEIVGGTFTITNMGPFGTALTLPIINQPQVAILATDGDHEGPVVVEGPDGDDTIAIHHVGHARARLGPPRVRRRVRRVVPPRDARDARDPRLGRRARMSRHASSGLARAVRWLGAGRRTARPRRCSARCTSARDDDYLLLLEHPHVYTLGLERRSRARARATGVGRRRAGARRPRWRRHVSRPGPARRLPDRHAAPSGAAGQRDVVAYVRRLEVGADRRCSPTSASRRT